MFSAMIQVPELGVELMKELGVERYLLLAVVGAGIGMMTWFLRRMAAAMDRMAEAQESTPTILAELKTLLVERMSSIDDKLDAVLTIVRENAHVARLWQAIEGRERAAKYPDLPETKETDR